MSFNAAADPAWIIEFRKIKSLADKINVYNALTDENRRLLAAKLTKPRLTKNDTILTGKIRDYNFPLFSPQFLTYCATGGIINLVHYLQLFDAGPVNLDLTIFTMDQVSKHFERGVYETFQKSALPMSAKQAWVYGFSFPDLIAGRMSQNRDMELVVSVEEFKVLIPSLMHFYRGAPDFKSFKDLLSYLDANLRMVSQSLKAITIEKIKALILFINQRGVRFEESDGQGLPIWHLNHVRMLPSWPEYYFCHHDSRMDSEVYKCIKTFPDGSLPYPTFKKESYFSYPAPLQRMITTMLCIRKFHPGSMNLHKDIFFGIFLTRIVGDFYRQAEDQLIEWKDLGQRYHDEVNETTLRARAIDSRICVGYSNTRKSETAYRLAAFDLGWTEVIDSGLGHATMYMNHWHVIKKEIKPDKIDNYLLVRKLAGICYDNNIPLSLIRTGKVRITARGEIVDLPAAIILATATHAKNASAAVRSINKKSPAKRARVTALEDR